ncbi:MAG: YceI family protein [Balneolaceae bacterium]
MATWNIDPTHTEVQFKAKHLVISTVTGNFKTFNGKIETKGDSFDGADVSFDADINSITTNNEDRDTHLKSDDFFNAEAYPKLSFESTSFKNTGGNSYELNGKLTIRDVTREVTLQAEHGGTVDDPYGQTKAGFEISGTLNRKEFGLKWNAVTEAGSVVVGDNIKLLMNVQVVKS